MAGARPMPERAQAISLTYAMTGRVIAFSVANALGLTPIAAGVDHAERCELLTRLGCCEGLGDLYGKWEPAQLRPPSRMIAG